MYKAYKFRLYPNDIQKQLIHKTFGYYRFIYNYFLSKCKNSRYIPVFDMCTDNNICELLKWKTKRKILLSSRYIFSE